MAEPNNSQDSPRKILGPIEWGALLIGLALLGYITFQKAGYHMVERSEETKFIDPASSHQLSPPAQKQSRSEKSVQKMLSEMAADLNDPSAIPQKDLQKRWDISESEASFYQKIQEESALQDQFQSTADWLRFLNASRKTYLRMRNLFAELSPNQHAETNANKILENEAAAGDFYQKMEEWYDLSAEEVESFAQEGHNSLEDWAAFLAKRNHTR